MRRLAVLSAVAVAATLGLASPASATCMETFDRFGVRTGTCAPPGGPAWSYVCYQETCVVY